QKAAGEAFNLSWDYFGRSSSPENHRLTQTFAEALEENGLIEERADTQIFSIDDDRFLPDRYIEGTCPNCGFERARGDQCDNCGSLLDPVDLIDPYSKISGSRNLEPRETRHLYLKQSAMPERLRDWIASRSDWPSLALSIAHKWLDEGLKDRAITRDLSWGVPVVKDGAVRPGFENKVFYVWFDAPIAYIAATEAWANENGRDWRSWWREDNGAGDVRYVQFMGKDNVAFHTVSFPVTLLGSGEPWKTVDALKAFNWLTWYGGKFSTSERRGVFMDQAIDLAPADAWRYYLIANAPESSDVSFTWEHFAGVVNKDLANVLGNFVNRITRFALSKFGDAAPEGGAWGAGEAALCAELDRRIAAYGAAFDAMEFRKAAAELRGAWAAGNEYLTEAAPWTAFKTDPATAAVSVRVGLNLIRLFAELSAPIIPATAGAMGQAMGLGEAPLNWPKGSAETLLQRMKPGARFEAPPLLFQKIEDAAIAEWSERFGGAEAAG
ncbi:MAG: methionine--tRNA ligase, partial [Pseudomonadota bacterium]